MKTFASEYEKNGARILKTFGYSYVLIGEMFGRRRETVATWCDPRRKQTAIRAYARYLAKREEKGLPRYVLNKPRSKEANLRRNIRAHARAQAQETGESLAAVYRQWGVL